MNKLTITEKVFVPVSVKDYEINPFQKTVFSLQTGNGKCVKYAHDISSIDEFILKEETNKYVLTENEITKLFTEGVNLGLTISTTTDEPFTNKKFKIIKSSFIDGVLNKILNKQ